MRRDLPNGDLPALILAVLGSEPRHGYSIAREVEQLSNDALRMKEGALYPALRVLEQDGLILGQWEPQEKGASRKVYTLTEAGKREMAKRTQELHDYVRMIEAVLEKLGQGDGHAQPA